MKKMMLGLLLIGSSLFAQNQLSKDNINVNIGNDGVVKSFTYAADKGEIDVAFRTNDLMKGPSLFFNENRLEVSKDGDMTFTGETDTLKYSLNYEIKDGAFVVNATVTNKLNSTINNPILTLKPGIDTELDSFPQWNKISIPTLLRCEKTHFWGYLMTPESDILAIGIKEPVASWQMEYYDPSHWRGLGGHLIYSFRMDLMHKLPLPVRHPQDLTTLKANETKKWHFYIKPVNHVNEVKPTMSALLDAPMIDAESYTVAAGDDVKIVVNSSTAVSAKMVAPSGKAKKLRLVSNGNGIFNLDYALNSGMGVYTLYVTDKNKNVAEAKFTARQQFSWYMEKARDASVISQQYASSHLENWLGLHSAFLARKYSINEEIDKAIEERLNLILSLQWDETTNIPKNMYDMRRVANTAQMISVLVDAYEATGNIYYLERARGFATVVMTYQYENGDYEDYTAIFYPVKSMMELMMVEQPLLDDPTWKLHYEKQWHSAQRAIDYLVERKDNILTEGQQTFEDCMIGVSASQMSMWAMLQKDPELKKHYTEAALVMAHKHQSLQQLIIPDSRMNGASLRFWEGQYDVLENKKRNMMNSPHGWSAWRIYGTYYLYLLTDEEEYLRSVKNALSTCVQLIDTESGELRWAFVSDPYCEVELLKDDPAVPGHGKFYETTVGEQYINMIGSFYYPSSPDQIMYGYKRVHGWSCENDVHEIFKCMEEICLTSAYVHENADGSWLTWNCDIVEENGVLVVNCDEDAIAGVHFNLKKAHEMDVHILSEKHSDTYNGAGWIGEATDVNANVYIPEQEPLRKQRGVR